MKRLIDYFAGQPLIVNLFTVMIFIAGAASIFALQKEMFPKVEYGVIIISTPYPGSSAEDVEKLVTLPIERELKTVEGVKKMNALSSEGRSIVYLELEADAVTSEVLDDVRASMDGVTDLPADAEVPIITNAESKSQSVIQIALTGVEDHDRLRFVAKQLRDKLERNSEISLVELGGYRVDEIRIEVDPDKLNQYELTLGEVSNSIKQRNLNLSAGTLESSDGDVLVRTLAEFESVEDIEKVVVRSNSSGRRVTIADLARVTRGPEDDAILQRANGEPGIFLGVKARETADVIRTTDKIKKQTEEFFKSDRYKDVHFTYTDDTSYYVKRRLNILTSNGMLGIILVFLCLLLFLDFRTSVVTSLGAPIAFMVSFMLMDYMGVSINLISMFALILVLGMLVDDSIIVAEQFYQKVEDGEDPKQAAKDAAWETLKPVTATILTTMVAFSALFFMGGIMGKFLWPVPAVVMICLAASWIECFFILPSHLADFCKGSKGEKSGRWYKPLLNLYERSLKRVTKYPFVVIFSFLALLGGSGFMASKMDFELFPGDDVRIVFLQLKGEVGTPRDATDLAVSKIEGLVLNELKKDELKLLKGRVGVLQGDQGSKTGSHYGSLILYLTAPDERERSTDEIINALTDKGKPLVPSYNLTVKKIAGGPPKGKPVEIELTSDSLNVLHETSLLVKKELEAIDGVSAVEIDFEDGKQQVVFYVNDEEARRLGLSVQSIAFELRRALAKDSVTEIRESDEDIEIKLMLQEESRKDMSGLLKLSILNDQGRRIPLLKVARFEEKPGAFVIRRLDQKRIFSVSAEALDKAKTNPVAVAKELKPKLEKVLAPYPNINFVFGGENEDTQESVQELFKAFGMAVMLIFFILVVMFSSLGQPAVVMSAIPLGMIGVIWAFKILDKSLGFMAMLGVVGLVGVVVNDSIVLVNMINKTRKEMDDLLEAIRVACLSRFRPVLLTTFTTVAGLLPIAHDPGGDPFLKPMALSFAYGLLFATFVTLMFVPCNYIAYVKTINFFGGLFSKFKKEDPLEVGRKESTTTSAG